MDYATSQILERLRPLQQAVIVVYEDKESLSSFIDTPSRWNRLRDRTYRQYLKDQNRRSSAPLGPQQDWSERESIEKKLQPNQRAFFQHLVLYDSKKQLIAGRAKRGANYVFQEISYKDRKIAFIGYIKPKAFLRSVDKLFVDQQVKTFALLSVLMIFAALLVTLFVSRWLVVPLSMLSRNAKRVAGGDFSVRMNFRTDDELGKLCQNFDDMTQSLEKNEITRKQWVADISHEMRTPLSVLKAQIEAMEDGIRKPTNENFQLLRRKVDSLSFIIDDLYELSLADLGALQLQKEAMDITLALTEVVDEFREKLTHKELRLVTDFPAVPVVINADKKRIKQLITNLVENSYRYTDTAGEIKIKLANDEQQATLSIEDSAPGVPEDAIAHIFDRLYRVEGSRNRDTGGAGLGLSICRGIVESHGGSIEAEKSALGGLKQIISFPHTL
ncbi:ATP-binding protein [Agarilytica rhodophyticola]|uniref:ATP-binding protein n=1 Tax=Agarilytica rhodophyticola TaxID=1737490 RepID=UPI0013158AD5|nr:ATP-binding protein [Agarilytica rhodophyticola]